MKKFSALIPALILLTSCSQAGAQSAPEMFEENCASCHGAGTQAGSAPSLFIGDFKHGDSLENITSNISAGIEDLGMPAFGGGLSDTEIMSLAAYIKSGVPVVKDPVLTTRDAIDKVDSLADQVEVSDFITGLDEPWGFVFLASDTVLLTEKTGALYRATPTGRTKISGVPAVNSGGQGGLLDLALDPDYSENGLIYLTFSHAQEGTSGPSMTKFIRGKIADNQWITEKTLFQADAEDYIDSRHHYGSRITFDDAGHVYFSIGDRGPKKNAQDISLPNGKIHRLNRDGSVPKDNPFVSGKYPSIYSFGNRNPQGLIIHPDTGVLWETEHGPKGGDELNAIKRGKNYGWPIISYGINYNGTELTPFKAKPGMEQPESQWTPSLAVCGLDVYTGDLFEGWNGRLLAGSLAYQSLRLIEVNGDKYVGEAEILKDQGRIRDVTTGPDGAIYVALPSKIVRLSPRGD